MIAHGKDIKIFSGTSNRPLAEAICKEMGMELGNAEVGAFSDGENFVSIYETVRGSAVFVVQSTCSFRKDDKSGSVTEALMELLIMIDAFKRASAGRITAVIPYYGYARQDRKNKARDPISAKPSEPNEMNLLRICDVHNVPVATNIATAEVLIHGLEHGDLDWRTIINPQR